MKHFLHSSLFVTVLAIGLASNLSAAFLVVDDFESATVGDSIGSVTGWTDNTDSHIIDVQLDPLDPGNQVIRTNGGSVNTSDGMAWKSLGGSIPTTSTAATLFFQMQFSVFDPQSRVFAGVSADTDPDIFDDGAAYAGGITNSSQFAARDGGSTTGLFTPVANTWYNVWLVIDNSSESYDVYVNTGTDGATAGDLFADDFDFRNGANGVPGALDKFIVIPLDPRDEDAYVDNIYVDVDGLNLANPVPEPSTIALVMIPGLIFFVLHRKRS